MKTTMTMTIFAYYNDDHNDYDDDAHDGFHFEI